MKYIKTAILIAGMAAATAACTRKPVVPQFGMLTIDTLIGTPANGCKIEYRFATIANAEKSPALRSCLLYTSPSPRDRSLSRMPSSA